MTGLLKKDLYYIQEYGIAYLPVLLLFCLLGGGVSGAYAMMLALALPRGTIANDARRWDRYAAMLPCGAGEIVAGKYLLCGAGIAAGAVITALSFPVFAAAAALLDLRAGFPMGWLDILEYTLIETCVAALLIALSLPAYYRFGVGKGQLGINILAMLFNQSSTVLLFNQLYRSPLAVKAGCVGGMALLAAAATFFSYRLSVYFYQRRRRGAYAK
ncbi:MAG: ABC-2 transporter permease [Oscillospiraceae bacterium]|jgi:hypothetical protein|nr:ABC-2 transporter permease [Oscillospiraceae bacterium]